MAAAYDAAPGEPSCQTGRVIALSAAALLAEKPVNDIPVDPRLIGLGAFCVLAVLLLVTLTFNRNR